MSLFDEARTWKIFAGPGCGKTFEIEQAIDSLLAEGVQPEEIMYILFNRNPAIAFRERYLKRGFQPRQITWWGTHHAICKKLLKIPAGKILNMPAWGKAHGFDFSSSFEPQNEYGWDAVLSSLSAKIYADKDNFTREEQRLLDALKETEFEEHAYCHVRYMQKALRLGLFPVGVKYVFVDEAQDNGLLQYRWLESVIARPEVKGVLIAGDDKQAINGFKGSDAQLFLDFPVERVKEITCTHRLPRKILDEANFIIEPVKKRSSLTTETTRKEPGTYLETEMIEEALYFLQKVVAEKKSVLVLCRNNCFIPAVQMFLAGEGFPIHAEWRQVLWEVIKAVHDIRLLDGVDERRLSAILPPLESKDGTLHINAYWEPGMVRKLRKGEFLDDPVMFEAFEVIRLGGVLPLNRLTELGFKPEFAEHVRKADIPYERWNLPPELMLQFKMSVAMFGVDVRPLRIETIHTIKGEEVDCVLLIKNVTRRTHEAEIEDADSERRVWYVAATRARETLIVTYLNQQKLRSTVI